MNSLLQTLYFSNRLRQAVYQMPTENDDCNKSVALALQRVFYELQHSDKAVGTKKLTRSFGWETLDSFMQHDAQELCRVLLDNMEMKMKGTVVESYIQCTNIDYRSSRDEPFYDIQLNVKGKKTVLDSFREYVKAEKLEGDNKYDAGTHGMQDARKGVAFKHFPPILHLHLLRFQYDPQTDTNYKINDRYEFPEKLNLDEFQEEPTSVPSRYTLHAVLVHSGDNHGGHYVAYINPKGDGKWYKFDDDVVSQATKKEAIENNFGGFEDEVVIRHCTNAYMLSYIRDSELQNVLCDVKEETIPEHLERKFTEEKRLEAQRRKEKSEAHLYMDIEVLTENDFHMWSGNDLFNMESFRSVKFKIQKKEKFKDAARIIAEAYGYTASQVRLWPFQKRSNNTTRPAMIEVRPDDQRRIESPEEMEVFFANDQEPNMLAYLETIDPESEMSSLPDFDYNNEVILFFKYYNPRTHTMSYCGHAYVDLKSSPTDLFPLLCKRAGLPKGTPLLLFEEIKPGNTERTKTDKRFDEVVQDLMDGDIICFQANEPDLSSYDLPTPVEYFKDLQYRVEVLFCNKAGSGNGNEQGFVVTLNLRMNYMQIAKHAATYLGVDPMKIQFFKPQIYRDQPGTAIKCTFDGHLRDLVALGRRGPKKLYYQILNMSIDILENKFQFKCTWVNGKLKDEKELVVFVDKQGLVKDLLQESKKHIDKSLEAKRIRLLEIVGSKIHRVVPEDQALDMIVTQAQKMYRIEEIPSDELTEKKNFIIVPVAHFQKEVVNSFGTPFLVHIKENDTISMLQNRIKDKLTLPEKEFEKIKFSLVNMGKVTYFPDEPNRQIVLSDFSSASPTNYGLMSSKAISTSKWVGLDHINKAPKRTRYAYTEKAIKIHN